MRAKTQIAKNQNTSLELKTNLAIDEHLDLLEVSSCRFAVHLSLLYI